MPWMKKALYPVSMAVFLTAAVIAAAPGDRNPFEPGPAREPEEQARQLRNQVQQQHFPQQVRVQVEFIELPHELLTELLYRSDPPSADAGTLRDILEARIKKGDATVLETLIATARSGEKASVESVSEFIYPTEYEKGAVPNSVTVSTGVSQTLEGESAAGGLELGKLAIPPLPTSFETRNLGATLEIEPTLGADGNVIDLRFAPSYVWHTGDTYFMEEKDRLGNVAKVQMPVIYTIRTNTALTLRDNQYQMPCVLTPKDGEGKSDPSRKIMLFVKCDVLTVK